MPRYLLTLAGPVPHGVAELIRARFGEVTIRAGTEESDGTVLEGPIADQAAVRALVTLLWDTGGEVRSLDVRA